MTELPFDAKGVVALSFGIVLMIIMFGHLAVAAGDIVNNPTNKTADVEIVGGSGVLESGTFTGIKSVNTVRTSLNDSLKLSGSSQSEFSTSVDTPVSGQWSFCTYARAESTVVSGNENRSIAGYNDIVLYYDGSHDQYGAWYYNESTRNSYVATVAAPNPTNQTLVCANHDRGNLTVSRNGTVGAPTSTTGANIAPAPPSANWNGTIEETRLFDRSLTDTQRSEWVASPLRSVTGSPPALRVTYDVRDRTTSSIPVYFASGSGTLSDATLVDGFTGEVLDEGTDYQVEGNKLVALDGGWLEGDGDVVYAAYALESWGTSMLSTVVTILKAVVIFAALAILAKAASAANEFMGGR